MSDTKPETAANAAIEASDRRRRRTLAFDLLLLVVVALTPRLAAVVWTVAPARDSFRFVDAALLLEQGPFLDALRRMDVHPLYPLTLLFARKLFTAVTGVDGAYAWMYAGQIASIVCYLGFLIASYFAGRLLWNRTLALLGCLAISLVPRQVGYSVDVLSDSLHAALWMSAFAFLVAGLQKKGAVPMALGAVLASMAFWTRVEAVLLPTTFAAVVVVNQLRPQWRLSWRRWLTLTVCFFVPYAILAGGYCWIIGSISTRGTAMVVIGAAHNPAPVIDKIPPAVSEDESAAVAPAIGPDAAVSATTLPVAAPAADEVAPIVDLTPHPYTHMEGYERSTFPVACWLLFREIGQETRGWLLALAVVAVLCWNRTRTRMPAGLLVFFAVFGCWAMLVLLRMRAGYIAGRYMTPVLPLLSIYAMTGAEAVARLVARLPRFPWERSFSTESLPVLRHMFTAAALATTALVLCAPAWFKPLHRHRFGHMQAAKWLREHTAPGELVFDPSRTPSFFAERGHWDPDAPTTEQFPVRYAVIEPAMVYRCAPHIHETIRAMNAEGAVVASFPRRPGDSEVGIYIFDLGPRQASQSARDDLR